MKRVVPAGPQHSGATGWGTDQEDEQFARFLKNLPDAPVPDALSCNEAFVQLSGTAFAVHPHGPSPGIHFSKDTKENNMTSSSVLSSNTATRAADSVHRAVDAAADAATPLIEGMASRAHDTVDRTAAAAGAVADKLSAAGEQAGAYGTRVYNSGITYVRENPLTAVAIAAAVGYLLSRVTR